MGVGSNIQRYVNSLLDQELQVAQALGSPMKAWNYDPSLVTTATNPVDQQVRFVPIFIPGKMPLTGLKFLMNAGASVAGPANNKVGLYSFDAIGINQIAASIDTPTLWTQAGGLVGAAFASSVALARSVVFGAFIHRAGTGTPFIGVRVASFSPIAVSLDLPTNIKTAFHINGATDLPASATWASLTLSTGGQPLMGVY